MAGVVDDSSDSARGGDPVSEVGARKRLALWLWRRRLTWRLAGWLRARARAAAGGSRLRGRSAVTLRRVALGLGVAVVLWLILRPAAPVSVSVGDIGAIEYT